MLKPPWLVYYRYIVGQTLTPGDGVEGWKLDISSESRMSGVTTHKWEKKSYKKERGRQREGEERKPYWSEKVRQSKLATNMEIEYRLTENLSSDDKLQWPGPSRQINQCTWPAVIYPDAWGFGGCGKFEGICPNLIQRQHLRFHPESLSDKLYFHRSQKDSGYT